MTLLAATGSHTCNDCGSAISDGDPMRWDPTRGSLTCATCIERAAEGAGLVVPSVVRSRPSVRRSPDLTDAEHDAEPPSPMSSADEQLTADEELAADQRLAADELPTGASVDDRQRPDVFVRPPAELDDAAPSALRPDRDPDPDFDERTQDGPSPAAVGAPRPAPARLDYDEEVIEPHSGPMGPSPVLTGQPRPFVADHLPPPDGPAATLLPPPPAVAVTATSDQSAGESFAGSQPPAAPDASSMDASLAAGVVDDRRPAPTGVEPGGAVPGAGPADLRWPRQDVANDVIRRLTDRRLLRSKHPIEGIVVASTGVWITASLSSGGACVLVDSTRSRRKPARLFVDGRRRATEIRFLDVAVDAVRSALHEAGGASIPVHGVVVVDDVELIDTRGPAGATVGAVSVMTAPAFENGCYGGPMTVASVDQVAALLDDRFPSA